MVLINTAGDALELQSEIAQVSRERLHQPVLLCSWKGSEKLAKLESLPLPLRLHELRMRPEEDICSRWLCCTRADMCVRIASAVRETPSAEAAWAFAALERKTAFKVQECLSAARALKRENLLDHPYA